MLAVLQHEMVILEIVYTQVTLYGMSRLHLEIHMCTTTIKEMEAINLRGQLWWHIKAWRKKREGGHEITLSNFKE